MISFEIWTLKEKETKLQACTEIAKKSMKQLLTASQIFFLLYSNNYSVLIQILQTELLPKV